MDSLYDLLAVGLYERFSSRSGVNHEGERDHLARRRVSGWRLFHVRHPIQARSAFAR